MKYDILMQHGVGSLLVSRTLANAQNPEESMPCTSSTKIQPDSRGLAAGIHALATEQEVDAWRRRGWPEPSASKATPSFGRRAGHDGREIGAGDALGRLI
jgi:hypothetical protein